MYGAYLVIKKISAKVPGPANSALRFFDCSKAWVMVIVMEKFVRASHQYYYIRCPAVLILLVGLNLQLAVALTVH